MATWTMAAKARNSFADMMEGLSPEQLDQQSLCSEWSAVGVLAHVTSFTETGAFALFATLLRNGFNFDKASVMMANKQLQKSPEQIIATLRANAGKSAPLPMFPEELTVSDCAIHMQDVRRPLGLDGALDPDVLRMALDFLTTNKKNKILISDLPPMDNVSLKATDMDWSYGSGKEISGPGEAIMMALARRPSALADLSGEGLSSWN